MFLSLQEAISTSKTESESKASDGDTVEVTKNVEESDITEEKMSDEEKSGSEESGSLEELDELEDIKKLKVSDVMHGETEEDKTQEIETVSKDPGAASPEYEIRGENLEEEKVREELLQKDKEEQLLAKEEELKKEEERRNKMRLLLSGYLELKAKKEIEKALLNEKKIIAQWLYPFRAAYQKEWELEMTKLKLAFQKALDYKKAHIYAIQRERKLCELNHLWADCSHYQISEELFEFMKKKCEKLKENYLEELEETKKYYLEREQQILDKCTKAEQQAQLLEYLRRNIHENILKQTKEALDHYKYQGEFLKEKEKELIDAKYMTYVEQIAHELQTSISLPEHRMEEIRNIFQEWKNKYETFTKVYAKTKAEMEVVANEISALEKRALSARTRLESMKKESKRQQQIQIEEIVDLQNVSQKYETIRPSLRKLISDSEEVMVQLRERKAKLEKIKKLKSFCDQLEAECDKIGSEIPYLDHNEQQELKENNCLSFIREICSEDIEDQSLLENLYRKVSRVKLHNQVLQHDIKKLKIDHMALRSDMKKYLGNIASGEWAKLPDELQLEAPIPDVGLVKSNVKDKASDDDEHLKYSLELLRRKCRPINSKIEKNVEKQYGKLK